MISWYLEQEIDGEWYHDERPWLPAQSPLSLAYCDDFTNDTQGLSLDVWHMLSKLACNGLPHDLSFEVDAKISRYIAHVDEEFLTWPSFGWSLVYDILESDWSSATVDSPKKNLAIKQWLKHLASLGNPFSLRLVFMLAR